MGNCNLAWELASAEAVAGFVLGDAAVGAPWDCAVTNTADAARAAKADALNPRRAGMVIR
jgi:hypothetical protein